LSENFASLSKKFEIRILDNETLKQDNAYLKYEIEILKQELKEQMNNNIKNNSSNNNNDIPFKQTTDNNNLNSDLFFSCNNINDNDNKISSNEKCEFCHKCKTDISNDINKYYCSDNNNKPYVICKNCINYEYFPKGNNINNQNLPNILNNNDNNNNKKVLLISSYNNIYKFYFEKKIKKKNLIKIKITNGSNIPFKGNLSFFLTINKNYEKNNNYYLEVIENEENETVIIEPHKSIMKDLKFHLINEQKNHKFKNIDLCFDISVNAFSESSSENDELIIINENDKDYKINFSQFYIAKNIDEFLSVNSININDNSIKKTIIDDMTTFVYENNYENERNFYQKLNELLRINKNYLIWYLLLAIYIY